WPDQRFHRAIIEATESARLDRAYADLQSEIVLCLVQLRPAYDQPAEVAAEHEELLAPIIAGDAAKAEALMRAHLEEATENLVRLHGAKADASEDGQA
ncbi:MAG TPA: FCD domain-containing protein, partial [Solirubrobacterales bacterium]|nr:FCD domain-containing protein [Solirubrobacterales bacterium]